MILIGQIVFTVLLVTLVVVTASIFFDQAILTRRDTVFRVKNKDKMVAITFDDGPSPIWTPQILDELKKVDAKATFFMIGHHVKKYPDVARRVADEGHQIGNHGYAHSVILYYTPPEIEEEIKYTEMVIRDITGQTTTCFRPPKAWMPEPIKQHIKSLGYAVVLWSLNSKDWVEFNHNLMVRYLTRTVKSGDIILFHDSGNVFSIEGGDRSQTVLAISSLVKILREQGYKLVTVEEMLNAA